MKQLDRMLLAMIVGIVVLVGVALGLALTRPTQGYLPDTTPGGVAHNYLLAIKSHDDQRAYGYLSPTLQGYPTTIDEFTSDTERYSWQFNREAATISIHTERITNNRAIVTLNETRFYQSGLFNSRQYSHQLSMTLERQSDTWKLISADSYWSTCWDEQRPC